MFFALGSDSGSMCGACILRVSLEQIPDLTRSHMARLFARWHRYKYRFVPWIAREFDRQIARNPVSSDRLSAASVFDEDRVKDQLIRLLFALHATACSPPPPHTADRNSHTRSTLASPAPRGDTRTQRSATHMSRLLPNTAAI